MADSNQVQWAAKYVALADVNERLYYENGRMAALIGEIEAVLADVEDGHADPLDLQGELRRIFRQGAPDD